MRTLRHPHTHTHTLHTIQFCHKWNTSIHYTIEAASSYRDVYAGYMHRVKKSFVCDTMRWDRVTCDRWGRWIPISAWLHGVAVVLQPRLNLSIENVNASHRVKQTLFPPLTSAVNPLIWPLNQLVWFVCDSGDVNVILFSLTAYIRFVRACCCASQLLPKRLRLTVVLWMSSNKI